MGLPDFFFQQFGGLSRATVPYRNIALGAFVQDSWKISSNFLLQYGARYDIEYISKGNATSALFQRAETLLGVVQFIPRDTNNVAPRLGFSWDPFANGRTVIRASYGLYYGHPLTGLRFLADVVDGVNSPFLVSSQLTGAADLFQGRAFTPIGTTLLTSSLGYRPDQQRFDPLAPAFLDVESALASSPILPTTLPIARNFRYSSSQQVTFGIERELSSDSTLSADYTYLHGLHIVRPRNINQGDFDLIAAYQRAVITCPSLPDVASSSCANAIYGGTGGPLAGLWDALAGC